MVLIVIENVMMDVILQYLIVIKKKVNVKIVKMDIIINIVVQIAMKDAIYQKRIVIKKMVNVKIA